LWVMTLCLSGAAPPTLAQDGTNPAIGKKWRPKDGLYVMANTTLTGPCENSAQYLFELGKKSVIGNESFRCDVKRLVDTAPGALRLDLICDGDEDGERPTKEVMAFRRIDDKSFFMRMSTKGKLSTREWRVNFCPRLPNPTSGQTTPRPQLPDMAEEMRKAGENSVRRAAWQPRAGVYAITGNDFEDHCKIAGDVAIEPVEILMSSGASRCVISSAEGSKDSIRLDVVCDQKPGTSGLVARSIRGEVVFVPPGAEKIIISRTGDQTIALQKSRDGEFSEPAQELAYCPEPAQRAYADSKKAK